MLAIEMLQGGHGDALVVEYGENDSVHRLLIDAGTFHSYPSVRARLLQRNDNEYDVFVVTHVDEDHIGGAVELLNDFGLRHKIDHVWFNGYVHVESGSNVLGPIDGERLTYRIVKGGFRWNQAFPPNIAPNTGGPIVVPTTDALPSVPLAGGATLYLLSPSGEKLKCMETKWAEVIRGAGLVPGTGTDRPAKVPKSHQRDVDPLPDELTPEHVAELAQRTSPDRSPANGSSIAFILEYGEARALLAADAHPNTLVAGLKRFGHMKGEERARIDLCKLPHHGSRANVTSTLIEAMDCSRYLVSTDGMSFGHPNDAALARIVQCTRGRAEIYCNYASERTHSWVKPAASVGASVWLPPSGETWMCVRVD